MELENYLKKFEDKKRKITKEQDLASQYYEFLGARLPFSRIIMMIKKSGYQYCFQLLSEMKQEAPQNPVALFIWKCKNDKINWSKNIKVGITKEKY